MNKPGLMKCCITALLFIIIIIDPARAQFTDHFNTPFITRDSNALEGWASFTGDGSAGIHFVPHSGYASICIDATNDQQNIWWALIKRCVSEYLDLGLLNKPDNEIRIEARIRVSHAPRRVNLSLNTNRTTDFHSNLMEFYIEDTLQWHTISFTTHDFDAVPGDHVFGQLALMDWGLEHYQVDVDYFKVDVVNTSTSGPDQGIQVPYRPPVKDVRLFSHHIPVNQDGIIDLQYPDMNFNHWGAPDDTGRTFLLALSGTQYPILRWDLDSLAGRKVNGSGILELTTFSSQRSSDYTKDFGMIRVIEVTGGDPSWTQGFVTLKSFCQGQPLNQVLNGQMIIDVDVTEGKGTRNYITIPQPVLQRLIDGKTKGIAIKPLGAVHASFYSMENSAGSLGAMLHVNVIH